MIRPFVVDEDCEPMDFAESPRSDMDRLLSRAILETLRREPAFCRSEAQLVELYESGTSKERLRALVKGRRRSEIRFGTGCYW